MVLGYAILSCRENTKRKQSLIPDHHFVHFDIPLTLEHESRLLQDAGFIIKKILDNPDGATIITAQKGDGSYEL